MCLAVKTRCSKLTSGAGDLDTEPWWRVSVGRSATLAGALPTGLGLSAALHNAV